jgi:RalA-binding protein 1
MESRISLPEEAKQYITNMTDSPITSPGADTFSSNSQLGMSVYPPPRSSSVDSEQDSEFLDMGDEEINDETDSEDAADVTVAAKDAGMQLLLSSLQSSFCSAELWHMVLTINSP